MGRLSIFCIILIVWDIFKPDAITQIRFHPTAKAVGFTAAWHDVSNNAVDAVLFHDVQKTHSGAARLFRASLPCRNKPFCDVQVIRISRKFF
jgi:hypothetical protein